jgi:hypothetical protein
MSADSGMSAADRMRAAQAQAAGEKRRAAAARHARERSRHVAYVLLGCGALAVLIGIGMQSGWLPTGFAPPGKLRPAKSDAFAETRAGQIRMPLRGELCREVVFDNDSGRFTASNTTRCDPAPEEIIELRSGTGGRLNAIRDSFGR